MGRLDSKEIFRFYIDLGESSPEIGKLEYFYAGLMYAQESNNADDIISKYKLFKFIELMKNKCTRANEEKYKLEERWRYYFVNLYDYLYDEKNSRFSDDFSL